MKKQLAKPLREDAAAFRRVRRHAFGIAPQTMLRRLGPIAIIPAVGVAAALAVYGLGGQPDDASATSRTSSSPDTPPDLPAANVLPPEMGTTLPPDHPPIGGGTSPHGAMLGSAARGDLAPPAIAWKRAPTWRDAPNSNQMRIATYRAPGGVEIVVSRAGGETEANVERWLGQFEHADPAERAERTVQGLHVVTIAVSGKYVGGGASMGGPAEPEAGWMLVGAIVESPGTPYFFKMTGPAAAVRAERRAFDGVVDGITPT